MMQEWTRDEQAALDSSRSCSTRGCLHRVSQLCSKLKSERQYKAPSNDQQIDFGSN
jgi:hypothetical protein